MIKLLDCVQTLELTQIGVDGASLFQTICTGAPRVRVLALIAINFATDVAQNCVIPPQLAKLDVSECRFVGSALYSFMEAITRQEATHPFFFAARSIYLSGNCFSGDANFKKMASNILEFDFSDNDVSGSCREFLNRFLFTQKRLRHISMDRVTTDDARSLGFMLDRLMRMDQMAGIDVNGLPEASFYGMLIPALQGARGLRHLGLKDARARDRGIRALESLLSSGAGRLVELQADGMGPRRDHRVTPDDPPDEEQLLDLWERIGLSESLVANDFPDGDLAAVMITTEEAQRKRPAIAKARRAEVTTAEGRLRCLIQNIDSGNAASIATAMSGQVYVGVHMATGMAPDTIPKKALAEKGTDSSEGSVGLSSHDASDSGSVKLPSDEGSYSYSYSRTN
jgi:hypothetical protein